MRETRVSHEFWLFWGLLPVFGAVKHVVKHKARTQHMQYLQCTHTVYSQQFLVDFVCFLSCIYGHGAIFKQNSGDGQL